MVVVLIIGGSTEAIIYWFVKISSCMLLKDAVRRTSLFLIFLLFLDFFFLELHVNLRKQNSLVKRLQKVAFVHPEMPVDFDPGFLLSVR